ncbi:hypothetical protein JYU34_000329 [Plutella xylostella]|uniref:Prostaglandin E synthase 2 n=1 Tax=Plutella xylostella TaxID=51655 RepID=A0ABQ7R7H4_PLUXY|nr:hypothetical protein JYU34_000329 [Plutella xylostella]
MWRPSFTLFRKVILTSTKETSAVSRVFYSSRGRAPRSTAKLTLVSASVGILLGAGYGGYTHYKVNSKKTQLPVENEQYIFLPKAPEYKPHYRVVNDADNSNLELIFFQYRTCPFCCKVRAYLDSRGLSYDVVEVDAVLRQAIKWSEYKKVPILLAKVDGGYQQLMDSTAIISVLETHLRDRTAQIKELIRFYPATRYTADDGKQTTEISNKYFIMHNQPMNNEAVRNAEIEEREWRKWADSVLVHMLSPNVYRTPGEALDTFKWFEEAGGWRDAFPAWECALMVYVGAAAMFFIAKRLKTRHHLKDDVRLSLYDAANKWTRELSKKGTKFHGGDQPNLADVSVFGVLSSIEGCQAFNDLREHTQIGQWYDDIKEVIHRRRGQVIPVKN